MLKEGEPFAASNLRFKCAGKDLVECSASLELSLFSPGGKTAEQRELVQRFRHKDWASYFGTLHPLAVLKTILLFSLLCFSTAAWMKLFRLMAEFSFL